MLRPPITYQRQARSVVLAIRGWRGMASRRSALLVERAFQGSPANSGQHAAADGQQRHSRTVPRNTDYAGASHKWPVK